MREVVSVRHPAEDNILHSRSGGMPLSEPDPQTDHCTPRQDHRRGAGRPSMSWRGRTYWFAKYFFYRDLARDRVVAD